MIKIQGTIVSPDYDDQFFADWIDRGIITPSSRVVAAIEAATEPFDLYINSYGGDVFAGGEMMIALLKASAAGKVRRCEVGSIAASMAANIVAALRANGAEVEAHANSQLMFHGCYTQTEGGAQHHEDVAQSLRNINDTVVADLNRLGITECRAWFSEGREKWIGAVEGKELNLFTTIVETDAVAPADAKPTAARLAAFASSVMSRKEYKMDIDNTIKADAAKTPVEPTPVEPVAEPTVEPATEPAAEPAPVEEPVKEPAEPVADDIEEKVQALANERFAKLQSAHDKMISDLKNGNVTLNADLAAAKAEAISLSEEVATLKASLAEVRDQLAKEKAAHESITAKALRPAKPVDHWTAAYRQACASKTSTNK